jgi:hypothetical protein
MLDCFLELDIVNQGQSSEIQSFRSDSKKALDFLFSSVEPVTDSHLSRDGFISPRNILTSFYDHSLCLPSSLSDDSLRSYINSLNYSAALSRYPSNEICLRNLSISVLWMGTQLGVGQRTENGIKDWLFPPPCDLSSLFLSNSHSLCLSLSHSLSLSVCLSLPLPASLLYHIIQVIQSKLTRNFHPLNLAPPRLRMKEV